MWHAVAARKVERALSVQGAHGPDAAAAWRAVAHRAEDLLTAAVMGRLAYLPDDLGLALLLGAATPCGDVAKPAPEPVTRSTPWPTWSDEDGAGASRTGSSRRRRTSTGSR